MIRTPRLSGLLAAFSCALATASVCGQAILTWTNSVGGNITTAANWDPNGQPNGNDGTGLQQIAQWNGRSKVDLVITNTTASLPNTGFNTIGINLVMTELQTNNVQLISVVAGSSAQIGVNFVSNNSPNASFIFGDFNAPANLMRLTGRPAGAVHYWINNSTNASIINPSVEWQAGGGTAYTFDFGGTGNWIVRNNLRNDNGSGGSSVTLEGPGNLTWTNGTKHVAQDPLNLITVNGGKMIIEGPTLFPAQNNNSTITINGGALVFDEGAQADTITRYIVGASPGELQIKSGTITLTSATNIFSGDINLAGGTLIAGAAETEGVYGPLGAGGKISFNGGALGFSVNNVYDYSARFNTGTNQAYAFDTGGQSVTFTNALSSSGGTLAKNGAGTLTLGGAIGYSGATRVNVGKLVLQGAKTGAGNIVVADSAALGINAAGPVVTPATLTLGTATGATLEFNGVNSAATAPLAATTLSATGTLLINVNSGTFTVGQSYPLLTWTSGAAPTVALGVLNGFAGTLSISGNTLRLNITGTAYRWTGLNSDVWNTSVANNWFQNGIAAIFANGGPVLFDDSSTRTTVNISGSVQPTSVTVDTILNSYTINSSSGNGIGGSSTLTKSGSSTATLSGGGNTYTGATTVSGGTLVVGSLGNGGAASDIGASSSAASSLVLNGGTLQYAGGAAASDRLFTVTTSGGSIDASGSGALNLSNTGSIGYVGNGPRNITLTGASTETNTLAAKVSDNGGVTTVTKNGAGSWVVTGANNYSGVTTISAGTLQVGAGDSGAIGSGNVVDNGTLRFNRTGSLTVSGAVSGSGRVINDGAGTVTLAGNNNYTGGTTINAGTLQIGSGGATGTLDVNAGITDNGTIIFNSTSALTLNSVISGTGNLVKRGSGLLKLLGNNTFSGWTRVDSGGVLQIASGNQGSFASPVITNNGSLLFVRQDNNVFRYTGTITGAGAVTKEANNDNNGDVTLLGTNDYTGGTFIRAGGLILGDGLTEGSGSITGNVTFANSSVSSVVPRNLTFNRPDSFVFNGNIVGAVTNSAANISGSVTHSGSGTVILTGTNTYPGGTTVAIGILEVGNGGTSGSIGTGGATINGTLAFNRSDDITVGGTLTGVGALYKTGAGALTLTASNTFNGFTTVSNGTLIVNGFDSASSTFVYGGGLGGTGTFNGPVTLEAGTKLQPGSLGGPIGTLTFNSDLVVNGNLAFHINKASAQSNDVVVVNGQLFNGGTGTLTITNAGPTSVAVGDKFTLFSKPVQAGGAINVTGAGANWVNNLATDGSISVASVIPVVATNIVFVRATNSLQLSWQGRFKLQAQTNSLGITTNWVDYPNFSNPITIPIVATNRAVFFRLISLP